MKTIKIKITQNIKQLAQKNRYQKVIEARKLDDYILSSSNFWAGDKQFQNYIGNIGELIFEQYLIQNNIQYEKDGLYLDRGDYFDFKINNKKIDIKTGHFKGDDFIKLETNSLSENYKFLISEKQCNKPVDFFVHIQIDKELEYAYIMGILPKDKVKDYEIIKTDNMYGSALSIPFNDLMPVISLFDNNKGLENWM